MYKQLLEVISTPESMVTYRHEMHCQIAQEETHPTITFAPSSPRNSQRTTAEIDDSINPYES